ncbi:NAD-dependent dehydratase [Geothrix limicola]|uniref:NAD-dependent dehydratase n=1 Tax=Geothrix limicola TaxID=2927978 RepID=A0ABQ5QDB8_9BACT|nr:SDR family oxidoreductase [Geothrix limicola]GLH72653.1 NAD-dependent dehydratase [Geothrix limicola]
MKTPPPNPAPPALIAGCGYLGTRLARRMAAEGPVLALTRSPASAEGLRRLGLRALAEDFDQPAANLDLPGDPGAVLYAAPPSGAGPEDLRLARFLESLGPARPQVLLYVSTTGVYGDAGGREVDEESPLAPREDRSRQRLDAERRATAWCDERKVRCVIFRVPAIYGPHRLPLERLQRREPVLREEDSGPGNRIHVDDLAGACLAALRGTASGAFNLTDGCAMSMAAFSCRVADLAGLPRPPRVSWAEAQTILSPGLLAFLRESRRVTSRRAQALGWTPVYRNPDDGIRASLLEMGWAAAEGASSAGR